MNNSKYKIDSVKVAKFKYVESYNSSYWNGKPREKIDITRVGLNADDYEDYKEYKVSEDKHNPMNKIDYYIKNNISTEQIKADISRMKKEYPDDEYWKKSEDELYKIVVEKINRKKLNPYFFSFSFLNLSVSEQKTVYENYEQRYPNDGLFYEGGIPGEDIDDPSKLKKLDYNEIVKKIEDGDINLDTYGEYLIYENQFEDKHNPFNMLETYDYYGSKNEDILFDINAMKIKYPNDEYWKKDSNQILSDINRMRVNFNYKDKYWESETSFNQYIDDSIARYELNPFSKIAYFKNHYTTDEEILKSIKEYRNKYPYDDIFYGRFPGDHKVTTDDLSSHYTGWNKVDGSTIPLHMYSPKVNSDYQVLQKIKNVINGNETDLEDNRPKELTDPMSASMLSYYAESSIDIQRIIYDVDNYYKFNNLLDRKKMVSNILKLIKSSNYDQNNPLNKIDYYVDNNIDEEIIRRDIQMMKEEYPLDSFYQKTEDEIYAQIIFQINEKRRIMENPMVYLFKIENSLNMSIEDILNYIKDYRKKYPNDGLFYADPTDPSIPQIPGHDARYKTTLLSDETIAYIINDYIIHNKKPGIEIYRGDGILAAAIDKVFDTSKVEILNYKIPECIDVTKYKSIKLSEEETKEIDEYNKIVSDLDLKIKNYEKELDALPLSGDNKTKSNITYISPITAKKYTFKDYNDLIKYKDKIENAKIKLENDQKRLKMLKSKFFNGIVEKQRFTDGYQDYLDKKGKISGEMLWEHMKWDGYSKEFDYEIIGNMTDDQATLFVYLKEIGDLKDKKGLDLAKEYYNSIKEEIKFSTAAEEAQKQLSEWIDENGNGKPLAGLDIIIKQYENGLDDFFKDVYYTIPWNDPNHEPTVEDYKKLIIAQTLIDQNPGLALTYNISYDVGKNTVPVSASVLATIISKNSNTGFMVYNALTALSTMGDIRIDANKSGHNSVESYFIGLGAGGINFAISQYMKKLPLFSVEGESAIRNILFAGISKGTSKMSNYLISKIVQGEPIEMKELLQEGLEGTVSGLLVGSLTNVMSIRVRNTNGKKRLITLPIEERSKLSQFFKLSTPGKSSIFVIKKLAPQFWKSIKSVIEEDPANDIDLEKYYDENYRNKTDKEIEAYLKVFDN